LYNKDKVKFLTALKDETIRYYKTLDNSNNRQDLLNFHVTYVEKAYELALKYKDCPPQQTQQTQQVQQAQQQTASNTLLTKEKVPPPALEYLPEDEFFDQTPVQIFNEVDYYRNVEVIDGSLWIATAGYSAQVQALYNSEKSGVSTKTKSGKEVIIAAKAMIDKAIARYPMIADKSKYPDAMNRLLALLLVAYNETRFTPQNENPNHTYNTAKRAKLRKVYSLTFDPFYNKFGVKAGQESKRVSGDAQTADPPAIFKYAYADYNGNGDEASGDGYKFRGRGYYGITFKNGYKEIGKVMYGDENKFITDPDSINVEPDATNAFLTSMFEGGLCALKVGLLAYTTTPAKVNGFNIGALVDVTLPNGTKKKIRGDLASNYTTFRGANNLVNGYTAQGYVDNFSNIFNSQELRDYINSKLK
jgi:predicted chitinase